MVSEFSPIISCELKILIQKHVALLSSVVDIWIPSCVHLALHYSNSITPLAICAVVLRKASENSQLFKKFGKVIAKPKELIRIIKLKCKYKK